MQFVVIYLLFTCFVSCPPPVMPCLAGCNCILDQVTCTSPSGTKLQSIPTPPDIPASTRYLRILRQSITRIRREDFQNLGNLISLEVGYSNVQIIEDDAFQYLTELTGLFLNGNRISTINRYTLRGLNKLYWLYIWGSRDLKMDPCSLSSLNSLTELRFYNTSVTINLSLWEDCENQSISPAVYGIEGLSIGGEDARIASDLLVNLTELRRLNILHPPVDLLMGYNISSWESMSYLRLDGLTFFPSEFLISDSLDSIYISISSFTHLPAYAFTNVSTLLRCTIRDSTLVYVHKDAFRGLTNLTHLTLSKNKIQTLPVGLLTDISSPVNLRLTSNPWNCNCSLYWLISAKNEQFVGSDGVSCNLPPALAGVRLTEVAVNITAPCDPPMTSSGLTPTPHPTIRTIGHPSSYGGASIQITSPAQLTTKTDTTTTSSKPSKLPEEESSLLDNWYYLALAVAVVVIILLVITVVVSWMRPAGTRKNNRGIDSVDSASGPSRDRPGIQMRVVGQTSAIISAPTDIGADYYSRVGNPGRNTADPANSETDHYYDVKHPGSGDERQADDRILEDSFEDPGDAASKPIVHEYSRNVTGYSQPIVHDFFTDQARGYDRNIGETIPE